MISFKEKMFCVNKKFPFIIGHLKGPIKKITSMSKLYMLVLFLVITFTRAGIQSLVASRALARTAELDDYPFQDDMAFNFPPAGSEYSFPTHVEYDGLDITTWFQSYFMTNSVDGKLTNKYIPEIHNTFRPKQFKK
jgi:hypothetical protein